MCLLEVPYFRSTDPNVKNDFYAFTSNIHDVHFINGILFIPVITSKVFDR